MEIAINWSGNDIIGRSVIGSIWHSLSVELKSNRQGFIMKVKNRAESSREPSHIDKSTI